MSDLKTRIGPKVGQELFPNKSWVRPGYEAKQRGASWVHHRRPSEGHGSDVSEHDSDHSPGRTPQANHTASLLTRMGLDSPDREEEGNRNMTPSLFERFAETEPDNRQRSDISVNHSVSALGERQQTPSETSESIRTQAQGPHMDPKTINNSADRLNQPVTTGDTTTSFDSNNPRLASQTSRNDSFREDHSNPAQYGHVNIHLTEQVSDKSSSFRDPVDGPPTQQNPNSHSTPATPLQPQLNPAPASSVSIQKTPSQQTVSEDGELPNRIIPRRDTPEEGEVHPGSLPAEKVRDLVLPLLLRIAAERVTDTERATVSPQSPPPVNKAALTDELLTSFAAKGTTEVGREMRARDGDSSSSAWRPPLSATTSKPDRSADASSVTSTAGPALVASRKETRPPTVHPAYDRAAAHGLPLRYHPSPKASESGQAFPVDHTNEPSSSKVPDTRVEPRAKRPRSHSPPPAPQPRFPRRRRSSSREEGPSTYERPRPQPDYGSRSTQGHGHTQSTYDRPHQAPGPPHLAGQPHRSPPLHHLPRKPHPASSALRSILAVPMTARSPSPMGRGTAREARSPVRAREIHSPPVSPPRAAYTPRPYTEREEGRWRGYSAHYGSSEYRDPRYRKPYEGRSVERRRSRPPLRRPSTTTEQQIPPSFKRRSRDSMDVDYDYRSKSPSSESRRDYTSSPQRPQRQDSQQRDPIPESPISRALSAQPDANAPFWSAKPGLDRLGILEWTFELDQYAATRLNLGRKMENNANFTDNASIQRPTSLKLSCYPKDQVIRLVKKVSLGQSPTPETSSINHAWPIRGHLIIKINEELIDFPGKTWLPDKLDPNCPPIVLDSFVRQGQNVIELIQLSGMADKVFWISEQDSDDTTGKLSVDDHGFAPLANSRALSKQIPITPAGVTISEILS